MNEIAAKLGEVGLPASVSELAAREWDAVVVGGGHNGLTAAAYLARAGSSVLVLERRERLGGACTLERPFEDERFVVSPCAYVVGLLDELVISELELRRRGFECYVADPYLWVPFDDGTAFGQWLDDARTQRNLEELGVVPKDIEGYWAYEHLFDAIRRKLRTGARDTWVGESPTRAEIAELLDGEQTMIDVVFDASIAEVLDDHALADAAREAGAVLACGVPVGAIVPEEGVVLEDGTRIRARTVVCNADPKVALGLLEGQDVPADYRERLEAWKVRSPVVKFNAALSALPEWTAAPGAAWPARATVGVTGGLEDALIERVAPGFEDRLLAYEVLGPPDIEQRIGLTGGNIFQGEVTPDQMWTERLSPRTPVPGLYFCGAATHPGGSVIALNGRNAARAVLADARELPAT